MSYSANQYNYATPLSSSSSLIVETGYAADNKYFSLHDNNLGGSYSVISGDIGIWGSELADSQGNLATPFVLTVTENLTINAIRVVGSQESFPVNFTVTFYNGDTALYTLTETGNSKVEYFKALERTYVVTKYTITVTQISKPGGVVRLLNAYNPGYVKRTDSARAKLVETSTMSQQIYFSKTDTLKVRSAAASTHKFTVKGTETLKAKLGEARSLRAQTNTMDSLKIATPTSRSLTSVVSGTDSLEVTSTYASAIKNTLDVRRDVLKVRSAGISKVNATVRTADGISIKESVAAFIRSDIVSTEALSIVTGERSGIANTMRVTTDSLNVAQAEARTFNNIIDPARDTLKIKQTASSPAALESFTTSADNLKLRSDDQPTLTNIHEVMKRPTRKIYGKVYITYTDPILDSESALTASTPAYNSVIEQVEDNNLEIDNKYFNLYENDLTGDYVVSDKYSQVGWTSAAVGDADGYFTESVWLKATFSERPIVNLALHFSEIAYARDFTVVYTLLDGTSQTFTYVDNTDSTIVITDRVRDVVAVELKVTRASQPGYPVNLVEAPLSSTLLYKGYDDESDIMSIDLLEELSYEDDVEALGGMSANEVTVVLDNSDRQFFFNNKKSIVASQLKRNRKIVPWLGAEIEPGIIEWYCLGTYWSYKWQVPVNGLTTTVVGFDTIGLLGATLFTNHQTLVDTTIGDAIEYVLDDAKSLFDFLEYEISSELYDVPIPYAWFEYDSHAAALRKISQCYPMHIYCNRQGQIVAAPQKLHLDYYHDVWSDDTNVIDKTYDSLYTALPNIIDVTLLAPQVIENESLVVDETGFNVHVSHSKTLNFSNPYLSDISLTVDATGVTYTYSVYSWGIVIDFLGEGVVNKIECFGTCLDLSNKTTVTGRDYERILLDGAIKRSISSDFIQSDEHAHTLLDRLFGLSETDKYDVKVQYRGDIALTINDSILLEGGIAPDNRYNIRRHELSWNGALTGSAELNT